MPMCRQFSFGVETLAEGELASHEHNQNVDLGNNRGYVPALTSFPSYNEEHPIHSGLGGYVSLGGTAESQYTVLSTAYSGGNSPHNNLAPVYGVYRFRRVK